MKEKKLKVAEIILKVLESRYPDWVMSWEIIKVNTPFGFLGQSADRIARGMAERGIIIREGRAEGSFYASYRAIPKEPKQLEIGVKAMYNIGNLVKL